MKIYFAKYLPVEGEIEKGDKALSGLFGSILSTYEGNNYWKTHDNELPKLILDWQHTGAFKKVKLFLCSRNIQIGDFIYREQFPDEPWEVFTKEPEDTNHGSWGFLKDVKPDDFKVIGEVSPEAIWIKEGDEFDEDIVERRWRTKDGLLTLPPRDPSNTSKSLVCLIQCTTCKTFH